MTFSKNFEKFDRVLTGRQSAFDMGSTFLKAGVMSDFLSISGKVLLLLQLLKISVNFS